MPVITFESRRFIQMLSQYAGSWMYWSQKGNVSASLLRQCGGHIAFACHTEKKNAIDRYLLATLIDWSQDGIFIMIWIAKTGIKNKSANQHWGCASRKTHNSSSWTAWVFSQHRRRWHSEKRAALRQTQELKTIELALFRCQTWWAHCRKSFWTSRSGVCRHCRWDSQRRQHPWCPRELDQNCKWIFSSLCRSICHLAPT